MTKFIHFFLNSDKLIAEAFFDISCLHGEDRLKSIFLTSEYLNLFLVIVELIGDVFNLILGEVEVLREFATCP